MTDLQRLEEKTDAILSDMGELKTQVATLNTSLDGSVLHRIEKLEKRDEEKTKILISVVIGIVIDVVMRVVYKVGGL